MNNAKNIADERLAKGEITKEEHADILATIEKGDASTNTASHVQKPDEAGGGAAFVGIVLLMAVAAFLYTCTQIGLNATR